MTNRCPSPSLYLDGVSYADLRQLELAITPHGFLKAALAAKDATAITLPIVGSSDAGLSQNGRRVTIVSFTIGKYRVNGTINDQNLVELTDTWFPNPVYGDMDYEMRYTKYKNFDGVQFPTLLHVHQGDPRLNPAHNYYEYNVTEVKANVPVTTMPVPDVVRTATVAPVKVESQKLADGLWLLGGGTHNSVLVEFKDFVAVVEAPQNEARSLAVIEEVNRLVPNKPIKYVVNTHHHFDHAGGLRTYLSQGTTVITHESNRQYYLDIMFYPAPRELQPDRMAFYSPMYMISRRPAPIETVSSQLGGPGGGADKYAITDGDAHIGDLSRAGYGLRVGRSVVRARQPQRRHADGLPSERKDLDQCRPLLAARTWRADTHSNGWNADALSEYAEAEAGRGATRSHSRTRRNQ